MIKIKKLEYVILMTRHGARPPAFPSNNNLPKIDIFENIDGGLTNQGRQETFYHGQSLFNRYQNYYQQQLLDIPIAIENFKSFCSFLPRTQLTAHMLQEGFKNNNKQYSEIEYKKLKEYQKNESVQVDRDAKVFMFAMGQQNSQLEYLKSQFNVPIYQSTNIRHQNVCNLIQPFKDQIIQFLNNTIKFDQLDVEKITGMSDYLQQLKHHNLKSSFENSDEFLKKCSDHIYLSYFDYYLNVKDGLKVQNHFLSKLYKKRLLQYQSRQEKLFHLSAHDITIYSLMIGLQIWEGKENPPLNSNLIFELFKESDQEGNSKKILNIFYNNQQIKPKWSKSSNGDISLEEITEKLDQLQFESTEQFLNACFGSESKWSEELYNKINKLNCSLDLLYLF